MKLHPLAQVYAVALVILSACCFMGIRAYADYEASKTLQVQWLEQASAQQLEDGYPGDEVARQQLKDAAKAAVQSEDAEAP